jgi:hypothetical protein
MSIAKRTRRRFQKDGALTADVVYAQTAFLFFRSGMIMQDDILDAKSLRKVQMPNRYGFIPAKPERQWKPGDPSQKS